MRKAVKEMHLVFECKDLGVLEEYVGCKIEHKRDEGWIKLMQPVLLQSFEDEFKLDQHGLVPHTPAKTGSVLERHKGDEVLGKKDYGKYQTEIGKLLHMARWTRLKTQNAVQECSKMNSTPNNISFKAMKRAM
eukprot:2691471-Ditylum_brightwellii.AAC.1